MARFVPALLLFLVLAASAARAQEFCVACTGPDALYRCVLTDARPGLGQSLQVACLTALAEEGRHAQCSVKRGVTVFECDAPVKKVSVLAAPAVAPAAKAEPPPETASKQPPQTVLEAAQRAKEASDAQWRKTNENMKQAGDATSTFFKRSLTCLGSLFTRCGADAP